VQSTITLNLLMPTLIVRLNNSRNASVSRNLKWEIYVTRPGTSYLKSQTFKTYTHLLL